MLTPSVHTNIMKIGSVKEHTRIDMVMAHMCIDALNCGMQIHLTREVEKFSHCTGIHNVDSVGMQL